MKYLELIQIFREKAKMTKNKHAISLDGKTIIPSPEFDSDLLTNIAWYPNSFNTHIDIANELHDKNPYTITILIKLLSNDLCRKKDHVQYTKVPISNLYQEMLFKKFNLEYGESNSNNLYAKWLEKYRSSWQKLGFDSIDNCIITKELEPRYKNGILSKHKNQQKLFQSRFKYKIERYYRLPKPMNWVDWRTPYDNLFIWNNGNTKYACRGGSGSSGSRETNSKFIYAFLSLNAQHPIPSYLFLYSENNILLFAHRFPSFTIPDYVIGSNYNIDSTLDQKLRHHGRFLKWDNWLNFDQFVTNYPTEASAGKLCRELDSL